MKIYCFDIKKGIFEFELDSLDTELHKHPTYEIILAQNGKITISSKDAIYSEVHLAIINKNISHKVNIENVNIRILMMEGFNSLLDDFLVKHQIQFNDGIYVSQNLPNSVKLFDTIKIFCKKHDLRKPLDWRIEKCLSYFEHATLDYYSMMEDLTKEVHLSESRLSHLFKQDIGISLKKYLVWSRLKQATLLFLNGEANLYHAALQSGFHDQAHLSKMFKKIFGVSPSDNYNSRIVQI